MAYLPKNKYKIKYTNGNEFILNKTGKSYTGDYIELTDGRFFAGEDLDNIIGPLTKQTKILNSGNINTSPLDNRIYLNLRKDILEKRNKQTPIEEHIPFPTPIDYNKGSFRRFLVMENNTRIFKEISPETYNSFNNGSYDTSKYSKFSILWSLKENNVSINNDMLLFYEPQLPGIFDFFPDKGQYGYRKGIVNLKTEEGTRIYPDGIYIDKKLPRVYQIGNSDINTTTNGEVPSNQSCRNCIFQQAKICSKWNEAEVRENYWCAAWETKVGS